ncbi:2-iminoacetate synthase ThiH [Saccharicrinis aurantiacus]|uniref:2-iminoacetate synthase ThiH n=1 Tax=Saccharicrinis aurantiacus TaxID=1849719 RepID=UPI00094F6E52|nr:2-iminoacetate synthase ThiH [Saccharicrinis aurantiacus]
MENSFLQVYNSYNWNDVKASILAKTDADVARALQKKDLDIEDFKALVSPAADQYLESLAQQSHKITQKRFGKTMQLFIPLYLSNECKNICTYCGLSITNRIARHTLSESQILKEVKALKALGFDNILLVSGESPTAVNIPYLQKVIQLIKPFFSKISIEVQPLEQNEYELLVTEGLYGVYVYQETYHKANYKKYHLAGQKSDFNNRIETPDRLGRANINTIGLGALYGLEDWRTESFFIALHLQYLRKQYWQTKYSISFPRIRPHEGSFTPNVPMSDKQLAQVICAYRLFDNDVELSLSTRESAHFRNHIVKMGVTSMSAGSKTNPGGYVTEKDSLEQFQISDERSPQEIEGMLNKINYEVVWKDWDVVFTK